MHFTKGKISMNQTTLDIRLYAEDEEDILSFQFDDGEGMVYLNSDSCQGQMKDVFSRLIKLSLENDVLLNLIIADDYGRGLYKDVSKEYVRELQKELDSVKDKIRREFI